MLGSHYRVIGERALHGESAVRLLGAISLLAGTAQLAFAAGRGEKRDADAIADGDAGDVRSQRFDASNAFMPERQRRERQLLQACDEQVRMADAASFHPHQRLSHAGLRRVLGDHNDLPARVT